MIRTALVVAAMLAALAVACQQPSMSTGDGGVPRPPTSAGGDILSWTKEKDAAEQSPEAKKALSSLVSRTDEVTGTTWFFADKESQRRQRTSTSDYFLVYFGRFRDGHVGPLRVQLQYGGRDWVFAHRLIVNADGKIYEIPVRHLNWKRDNAGGKVWETLDVPVEDLFRSVESFEQVLRAQRTIVRFSGDRSHDFTVPASQRKSVQVALTAWKTTKPRQSFFQTEEERQ